MIKLVKIELKKLFAKKMIYIFLGIIVVLTLGIVIIDKNVNKFYEGIEYGLNAELYKSSMEGYDLNDPEQLEYYVEDKTYYDTIMLAKDYEVYSSEHLYVEDEIRETISCMNENEFITKDKEAYNECKKKYDEQIDFLKHFDGKKLIQMRLDEVNERISSIEFGLNASALDSETMENELNVLKLQKEVLEYRLENNILIDGSVLSGQLDLYVASYMNYLGFDNDKNYVDRRDSFAKRKAEEEYYIAKYKFEHNMYEDYHRTASYDTTASEVEDIFNGGFFTLLFLVLVGGSIVAEEFNKGTIKQLLLKPYSRTKIMTSKIIAAICAFIFFLVCYACAVIIINAIAYGEVKSLFEPLLYYHFGTHEVIKHSLLFACLERIVVIMPMYLILLGISILVGVITTNTAVSIIVPIVFNTAAGIINMLAQGKIFAYFPTMCWNLSEYLHGGIPEFKYSTLSTSIIVDIVTIVLLYGACILIFKKKDIKNQ
ncbi:MAG: ABC transporter permease subunit [Bacilli bacterium]|nr:ABC transporter permease subunit [Bacilli bacterium]